MKWNPVSRCGIMNYLEGYFNKYCVNCLGSGVIKVKRETRHYSGSFIVTYDKYKCKLCNGTGLKQEKIRKGCNATCTADPLR